MSNPGFLVSFSNTLTFHCPNFNTHNSAISDGTLQGSRFIYLICEIKVKHWSYIFANIFKCFPEVDLPELAVGSAILWSAFGGTAGKWWPVRVFPFSIQVAWSLRSWMLYCGSVWQTLKTLQAHLFWGGSEKRKHLVAHCYQLATNSKKAELEFSWLPVCSSAVENRKIHFHRLSCCPPKSFSSCTTVWFYDTRFICIYIFLNEDF